MKLILKETVEHYHVIDIDDNFTTEEFTEDLAKVDPQDGIEAIKDLLNDLSYYGISSKIHEDGAGKETTLMEVVDEYEE